MIARDMNNDGLVDIIVPEVGEVDLIILKNTGAGFEKIKKGVCFDGVFIIQIQ